MRTFTIDDSTVTVEHVGPDYDSDFSAFRQRYAYSIVTPQWRYDGSDIRSGCGDKPDEDHAARALFSFLYACAESRRYPEGENSDLFPEYVGEWTEMNSDELSLLSAEPEDED